MLMDWPMGYDGGEIIPALVEPTVCASISPAS